MSSSYETITPRHQGQRYRVQRSTTNHDDPDSAIHEYWEGHGVIGCYRKWLGHRYTSRLYWYAAVNPTGTAGKATHQAEQLPTRRAAITWLLNHP